MKNTINTLATKAAAILVAVLLLTSAVTAQVSKEHKPAVSQKGVANLIAGIKSENEGVRKCSIYFAGKYEIDEVEDALIEQLEEEKVSNLRVLIALALYRIGGEEGLEAISANSASEKDPHAKAIFSAIVEEYNANKNVLAAKAQ